MFAPIHPVLIERPGQTHVPLQTVSFRAFSGPDRPLRAIKMSVRLQSWVAMENSATIEGHFTLSNRRILIDINACHDIFVFDAHFSLAPVLPDLGLNQSQRQAAVALLFYDEPADSERAIRYKSGETLHCWIKGKLTNPTKILYREADSYDVFIESNEVLVQFLILFLSSDPLTFPDLYQPTADLI